MDNPKNGSTERSSASGRDREDVAVYLDFENLYISLKTTVKMDPNFDLLMEKPGRHPGQIVGRSPYLQPVQAMAPQSLIGEIVPVEIFEVGPNSLFGALTAPRVQAEAARFTELVAGA